MTEDLLIIGHSKRTESVPHWLHPATLATLTQPCKTADIYESHIFDIGQSRSEIVRLALQVPEMTHLLFVDDDIIAPDKNSLVTMFSFMAQEKASIVSGLYYNKNHPHQPLIMSLAERGGKLVFAFPYLTDPPRNKALKVGCVPAGFLMVKREVFEKLKFPPFIYGDPEVTRKFHEIEGHTPGEDVYFSFKTREAGYDLWVHCGVRLLHYVPTFVGPKDLVDSYITHNLERSEQLSGLKDALAISREAEG